MLLGRKKSQNGDSPLMHKVDLIIQAGEISEVQRSEINHQLAIGALQAPDAAAIDRLARAIKHKRVRVRAD